jgi:hypothetical protein
VLRQHGQRGQTWTTWTTGRGRKNQGGVNGTHPCAYVCSFGTGTWVPDEQLVMRYAGL